MSIVVVTGVGPRTGTSFVMKKAKDAGLPIIGKPFDKTLVPEHNPNGYFETTSTKPKVLNNHVVKLWSPDLALIPQFLISKIVILERKDKLAQMHSTYKVFKDECKLTPDLAKMYNPSTIIQEHDAYLKQWSKQFNQNNIMRVYTEDLNDSIESILSFLERGLTWA
jgi:hypothetical protein